MATSFLRPRSVQLPPQGAYDYIPVVKLYESDSAAGLEALLSGGFGVESLDPDNYYVIESIEYEVEYKPAPMAEWRYSALVWATQVLKV